MGGFFLHFFLVQDISKVYYSMSKASFGSAVNAMKVQYHISKNMSKFLVSGFDNKAAPGA